MQSTTGSTRRVVCGGEVVWCDLDCFRCEKARVLYPTQNETSSSGTSIHIVESPVHYIDW